LPVGLGLPGFAQAAGAAVIAEDDVVGNGQLWIQLPALGHECQPVLCHEHDIRGRRGTAEYLDAATPSDEPGDAHDDAALAVTVRTHKRYTLTFADGEADLAH